MNITITPEIFGQIQSYNCSSQRTFLIDSVNAFCQGIPVWLYLAVCASSLATIIFVVLKHKGMEEEALWAGRAVLFINLGVIMTILWALLF